MSENWITKNLKNGPLVNNYYDSIITGLTSNTVYEYRAYMIVDGDIYYGETCKTATKPIIISAPQLKTGNMSGITTNSMYSYDNFMWFNGNSPIIEYGLLYTQNPYYGVGNRLIYENTPNNVNIKTINGTLSVGNTFFNANTNQITDLQDNTTIYYRAYAKNSSCIGYGNIKTAITLQEIPNPTLLSLITEEQTAINTSRGVVDYTLSTDQFVEYNIKINHCVELNGYATTNIYCKACGSSIFDNIYSYTSYVITTNLPQYKNIKMCEGDIICWDHCTFGGSGSYSSIELDSILSYSSDTNPVISSQYFCSRIENDGTIIE